VLILTFLFMFIFDMLSVKALITCENVKDNLREQLLINRRKIGFIIAYWIFVLASSSMFFQAYLRGLQYETVTDPYIIVTW
jgi:hypothetical protein